MKQKLLPAIIVVSVFALAFGLTGFFAGRNNQPQVSQPETLKGAATNKYNTASTTTFTSSKIFQLKTGYFILSSITIASSSATAFKVKNATSSTDIASTTIASFPAAADEMTYDFGLSASRGLIIESTSGFNGNVIINYQ